ncbi:MAG: hypothetical protein U9P90_04335, partial [Patescibacteria group bacterium]|nr:hypothetical protein [Patescibacteria group bacterium]
MKKIIFLLLFAILLAPIVSSAQGKQQGVQKEEAVMIEDGVAIDQEEIVILDKEEDGDEDEEDVPQVRKEKRERVKVEDVGGDSEETESGDLGLIIGMQDKGGKSEERRSRVSNAVREMLQVADRSGGIGEQIRVVAQEQNRVQEEAENALTEANNRGRFMKFIIGPDFRRLKTVEERLENHTQKLDELEDLRGQLENEEDKALLDEQIEVMENVKQELEEQVVENKKGFSLFGWLF